MGRRQLLPCLAAAAVAGCRTGARQPRKLRIALMPRFTLAPLYLADFGAALVRQRPRRHILNDLQCSDDPVHTAGRITETSTTSRQVQLALKWVS